MKPSDPLTFAELRKADVLRTESEVFGPGTKLMDWSPTDWGCALAGEVGEACNLVKKRRRCEDIATQEIAAELADVVIYADLMAARLGIDLGAAVREKFNYVSRKRGSDVMLPELEGHHEVVKFAGKLLSTIRENNGQWVIFRAKDNAVPPTLQFYVNQCVDLGASPDQIRAARALLDRALAWRAQNPHLCRTVADDPCSTNLFGIHDVVKFDGKLYSAVVDENNGQWIILLAKDNAVPPTLQFYINRCIDLGASHDQIGEARALFDQVLVWRAQNPHLCKVPDVDL